MKPIAEVKRRPIKVSTIFAARKFPGKLAIYYMSRTR